MSGFFVVTGADGAPCMVCAPPLGGGADDSPNLEIALATGLRVCTIPGETYCLNTPLDLPDNAQLCGDGSIFTSTMPATAGHTNALFKADRYATIANGTTLAAAALRYDTTLTLTDATAYVIGGHVAVTGTACMTVYEILNKVGNVLTLDRPVLRPWPIASPVFTISPGLRIRLSLRAARITAGCDRALSLIGCIGAFVDAENCQVTWTANNVESIWAFDIGGRENVSRGGRLDGGGHAFTLSTIEHNEHSMMVGMELRNAKAACGPGFGIFGGIYCSGLDLEIEGCDKGAWIGKMGGDTWGSYRCTVARSHIVGCVYGGTITDGSNGCIIESSSAEGSSVAWRATVAGTDSNSFAHIIADASPYGLSVEVATRTTVEDLHISGSNVAAVQLANGADLIGTDLSIDVPDAACIGVFQNSTGSCLLKGLKVVGVRAAEDWQCVVVNGTGGAEIDGFHLQGPATKRGYGIYLGAATEVRFANGRFVDLKAGAIALAANSFMRKGCNVDETACAFTGYAWAGQPQRYSYGEIVLTGAVAVPIACTGIRANDGIWYSLKTVGGVPGMKPNEATRTNGVGWTAFGTAGDTSTYFYGLTTG